MEMTNRIIGYMEEKHRCVCDNHQTEKENIVLELRTMTHDAEYTCLVTLNRETRFVVAYEFLWSWHRPVQQTEIVEAPKKLVAPTPTTVRRTVRRTVNEAVYA